MGMGMVLLYPTHTLPIAILSGEVGFSSSVVAQDIFVILVGGEALKVKRTILQI